MSVSSNPCRVVIESYRDRSLAEMIQSWIISCRATPSLRQCSGQMWESPTFQGRVSKILSPFPRHPDVERVSDAMRRAPSPTARAAPSRSVPSAQWPPANLR